MSKEPCNEFTEVDSLRVAFPTIDALLSLEFMAAGIEGSEWPFLYARENMDSKLTLIFLNGKKKMVFCVVVDLDAVYGHCEEGQFYTISDFKERCPKAWDVVRDCLSRRRAMLAAKNKYHYSVEELNKMMV